MEENKMVEIQRIFQSIEFLIGIGVIFLTVVLLLWFRRRKQKGRAVLLVGLSGSGKTLLFSQLLHRQSLLTLTSVKENSGSLDLGNKKTLKVIDIPGHERVRQRFFDLWKSSVKGIVFVVDSVSYNKELKDIADYLYNILTDPAIASSCPSVLIFCNKQDQAAARGQQLLKASLEKEMNILRDNRSRLLDSSGAANNNAYLGKRGKDFSFSDLGPIRVDFAEGYATNKNITSCDENDAKSDIQSVNNWILKL